MYYHDIRLRHELKYYISLGEYALLRARLAPMLRLDENTVDPEGYLIRSLYFDDMYDSAMVEKLDGTLRRDKYRVRVYNGSDAVIHMERKSKYESYISKDSAPLTRAQFDAMLSGDYDSLRTSDRPLLREVYQKRRTALLRPAVIVDYIREAYTLEAGNVRITFDKDIRAGIDSYDVFSRDVFTYPVVEAGQMVLEIKYDDFLPGFVRNALRPVEGNISAISKYVMCRTRLSDFRHVSRRVSGCVNG